MYVTERHIVVLVAHTHTHTHTGSDFLTAENRQSNKVHTQVYTSVSQSQQAVKHGSPSLIAQSTHTHTHTHEQR